jgi:hypothetical protein
MRPDNTNGRVPREICNSLVVPVASDAQIGRGPRQLENGSAFPINRNVWSKVIRVVDIPGRTGRPDDVLTRL